MSPGRAPVSPLLDGGGETRLVEHMANQLGVSLFTVSCHEDMTASDLLGRFILREPNTEWGRRAANACRARRRYLLLDEEVEVRRHAVVAVHLLADHRRELNIECLGGVKTMRQKDPTPRASATVTDDAVRVS